MKKVMFSFAIAFCFFVSINAQDVADNQKTININNTMPNRISTTLTVSRHPAISIWFGKAGCNPGFGICRIDIGRNAMAANRLDPNQLTGTYVKNADGTVTMELDGNKNKAFVDKLVANGGMELDQDYDLTTDNGEKITLKQGRYDLKKTIKKVDDAQARMIHGTITIVIGKVTIVIKW